MHYPVFLAVLAAFANAQTLTTTDLFGNTIVEVVTTNALGNAVTSTLETLAPVAATTQVNAATTTSTSTPLAIATTTSTTTSTASTATAATTATTTAQQGEQGPVGQPASTSFSPGGPTPYTYTTIIGGVTEVLTDVFTPTNPATVSTNIGSSGTIWAYSSWLAEFGPTSSASAGANAADSSRFRSGIASSLVLGFAIGMGLVLR
ncbi:hypothetical protein H0H92_004720 [Tricholoma furcatifolium]|nr:hypothetical protein H0H92_004720 [Tricholoma furcatifolium]